MIKSAIKNNISLSNLSVILCRITSYNMNRICAILICLCVGFGNIYAQPSITNFTPSSGSIGTLVTITGTNLNNPTAITIGGVSAIPISNTGTSLVAMVMPGATTGAVSLTTAGGTANGTGNFTVTATQAPNTLQGSKLEGTGATIITDALNLGSCAISADGNTAIISRPTDNNRIGAVWIFIRSGGVWIQQGEKLVGTGESGASLQGSSVSISADGNTILVGGYGDNSNIGAIWVYSRSGGVWSQQGAKLVGTGGSGASKQGFSVSISADGNTAIVGGRDDNNSVGASWIYTRSGGIWSQQGAKLVGSGASGAASQGNCVSISADGNTAIVGGNSDNNGMGAVWVYTRSGGVWGQQGSKLIGTGGVGNSNFKQGSSVAISADGNTAIIGSIGDNWGIGAVWIFSRNASGVWSQQGNKLVGIGSSGSSWQGSSVSLSADGNTAIVGGPNDNNNIGAAWIYTRSNGVWIQAGTKLVATGVTEYSAFPGQGYNISISADGNTAIVGGLPNSNEAGAAWVYTYVTPPPTITNFSATFGPIGTLVTITGTNLYNPTAINIGGVSAIPISNTGTSLVAMVMPGATTGAISVTTAAGNAIGTGNFTATTSQVPNAQQGNKLVGSGAIGSAQQGTSVAVSADGNTAVIGGSNDNNNNGAAWIYTRLNGVWSQQGNKLVGTGATGTAYQGTSVAISADGNKVIVGGNTDSDGVGAAWVFARVNNVWTQQGNKLVGTGGSGPTKQGSSVALSADGNTAAIGGSFDNAGIGATWVFTYNAGVWSQAGNKLVGSGAVGNANQGTSIDLSADGNTLIIGGYQDNSNAGAAWIFTRSGGTWTQQGNKIVGSGAVGAANQGISVALNADGNSAIIGGNSDNGNLGAVWIFTRSGTNWVQQGNKLVGTGSALINLQGTVPQQGTSVSISADGNTAVVGAYRDSAFTGAVWVFRRNGSTWTQQGSKLVGTGAVFGAFDAPRQGWDVAISKDGSTIIVGGVSDNNNSGAVWVYTYVTTTPNITNFTGTSGPVGTLVTIRGTNLNSPTAITIAGVAALPISNTGTSLVAMVMPGATTGGVSVTTTEGTANATGNFTVTASQAPNAQQDFKLVGANASRDAKQGYSVSVSADGNTAIVGGYIDSNIAGAVWIYTRNRGVWSQQGNKLVGSGAINNAMQGFSVSLSADGNTAIVGGLYDDNQAGAVWIFTRNGEVWSQQGSKLVGSGAILKAQQGVSVSISADGNTALVGGERDNDGKGAVWVYTRTGNVWTQQGNKLVGTLYFGHSVCLSADGNTAMVGSNRDNGDQGAVWVYTRTGNVWTQQGSKLVGTGASGNAQQGYSVSLSADGNTAIVGGNGDNNGVGAAWIWTRSGGIWSQQGSKLIGTGAIGNSNQGNSVSISADGNTAIIGGRYDGWYDRGLSDNVGMFGASWIFKRNGTQWIQQGNKLVGSNIVGFANFGSSVSISADGSTAVLGGYLDNGEAGAAWVYTYVTPSPAITNFTATSGPVGTLVTITGTNLNNPTAITIGGVAAIPISNTGTSLVAMVMPGATTGAVSVTSVGGTANGTGNFTVTASQAPNAQQGSKLVGAGGVGNMGFGNSIAVSADGNTAIVGGNRDDNFKGAVWIYTKNGNVWTQQGSKLIGTGGVGNSNLNQGWSVAISADGNTAMVGSLGDNNGIGAVWIFSRNASGVWSQQGNKLVGNGVNGSNVQQGFSVSISADGNTAFVGGPQDNGGVGAAWVYTRSNGVWTQQGNKLVGTSLLGTAGFGWDVTLSADGNTAIIGGPQDNGGVGAAWIFSKNSSGDWIQQGNKLVGSGAIGNANQGISLALSADGNTAIIGGNTDNSTIGATWVFTRTGVNWSQQGSKLVGTGNTGTSSQGYFVSLSADGNTALIGGNADSLNRGASWIFRRNGTNWSQVSNKLVGTGGTSIAEQGRAVSISADGNTILVGGSGDNNSNGAVWTYIYVPPPTITNFTATSGSVGTLVTITGTNLNNPTAITIGGVSAIPISNTGTSLVAMVMPGATTGTVSVTTAGGTANGTGSFTVIANQAPNTQQGGKLVGTGATGAAQQGRSVAISANGNTAIIGAPNDNNNIGAVWIWTRSGSTWTQQGNKLVGTGASGAANQGSSVAISADGNTVIVGGQNDSSGSGAIWIFTRSGNTWTQQGTKLYGTGAIGAAQQGFSVAISADGNTAIVGGHEDQMKSGAAWVFNRVAGVWSQQGNKLVGSGAEARQSQGCSVALSADGNTAIIGGQGDISVGAAWIFTRSGSIWTQQGNKLVGSGAIGNSSQGFSVSLSADGNTAIVGGFTDNSNKGAAWIFVRNGGVWSQQGNKLVGTGAGGDISQQSTSVSLSADGNTAIIGGPWDYGLNNTNPPTGAIWVYSRSGSTWTQQGNKLVGAGSVGTAQLGVQQGFSVALSSDGNTVLVGGYADNSQNGASWVYTYVVQTPPPTITNYTATSGPVGTLVTITGTNLNNPTAITIGGVAAIPISNTGTSLVAMVMPGATTGTVSVTTAGGTGNGTGNFTVTTIQPPIIQQGNKLVGTPASANVQQGYSVSVSADGNTAIVGGSYDNAAVGAAWIYTRSGGVWTQQGAKLVGTGSIGESRQGESVSISADGNTAIVGGAYDNNNGAAWVFIRTNGVWSQQGAKLVGTGAIGFALQGASVSLSADGNTAIIGGPGDNGTIGTPTGAAWIFTRVDGVWIQQGNKLVGTGGQDAPNSAFVNFFAQGESVSISADGNTAAVGGWFENGGAGATWIFTRNGSTWTQQGNKLIGTGAIGRASQGRSVALSADGNTLAVGGPSDNSATGAVWIFTRIGSTWTQQGNKLVGTGTNGEAKQGKVSLSADGNILIVGGSSDGRIGSSWVYVRNGSTWTQQGNKLVGTGTVDANGQTYGVQFGGSTAISADGTTAFIGGKGDNNNAGATWVYSNQPLPVITSSSTSLNALATTYGTASSNTSFIVSGASLINVLNIAAPVGFELSLNPNSGFSNNLSITQINGTVAASTIYVRLKATNTVAASPYSGNIVCTSTNATSINIPIAASAVTAKQLLITGVVANNKIFDGNNTATLTGTARLSGVISTDSLNITLGGTPVATFAKTSIDTGIAVTVSGYSLSGTAASNYTLSQPSGLKASILSLNTTWLGINTNWNNVANWDNGIPSNAQTAIIPNTTILPTLGSNITIDALVINRNATLTNNGTIQLVSNVTNNGTISGTGNILFNSNKAQIINGKGTINNVTINNTNGVSIAADTSNLQTLTSLLTMVAGTLNTNNNLVLQSNATRSAYVAPIPIGASITGAVAAQSWLLGQRGFRLLGHPFNGALPLSQLTDNVAISGSGNGFVSGVGFSSASASALDSSDNNSARIALSNSPNSASSLVWSVNRGIQLLVRGKGNEGLGGVYSSTNEPSAFAIDAAGTLNQGTMPDYNLGVNPLRNSFTAVGNPYPAPINVKLVKSNGGSLLSANNGSTGVSNTVYIYNPIKSPGISALPNQEMRGGYDAYTNDGATNIIIPMFGSFIVNSKGVGNIVKFEEAMKEVDASPLQILSNPNKYELGFSIENEKGKWDDLKIRFEKGSFAMGNDSYDGRKLSNDLLDFYTISSDGIKLTIDARTDSFNKEEIIPIGLSTRIANEKFAIKIASINLPQGVHVYFRDKLLGKEMLLQKQNDTYEFSITSDSSTRGDNRFELMVKKVSFVGNIQEETTKADATIGPLPFSNQLTIQLNKVAVSSTSNTTISLYSIDGKLLKTISVTPLTNKILFYGGELAQGVYLLEIKNDKFKQIKQVIKY